MFGAATQQPAASTGFGGFGQAAPTTPATSTAAGGFGGFGQQTPATSTATTGGFGGFSQTPATSTAATTGFGGFGQTPAATSTPFGQAPTATSAPLFGQAPTATSTPFGQAPTATSTPFGATATPAATSTPFGQQPATSSSFSFGGLSSAPATSTATTGFGGFGNTTATSAAGGSGGLFGANTAGAAKPSFSLSTPSLFGANKPAATTTTGFGGFGQQSSLLGGGANATQQRDQQIYQLLVQADQEARKAAVPSITSDDYKPDNVWQALALLKSWWDPTSPNCRFKHYFYNVVNPQEVPLYVKPADHDKAAWDAAQAANPDPTTLVPALAIGFDDVQKRLDQQHRLSEAHSAKLKEIQDILKKIQSKDMVETATKLAEYKRKHMEAAQRVIKFLKYTQVLRNKGLSITPDEEAMRARFENIHDQLQRSEQFHGKLSQLWAQLQLIKESGRKYGKTSGVDEWDSVSENDMRGITKILEEQDNGVQHIIEVINKDTKDIEMLSKGYRR